ncbi:kinase domain protein [Rhizoctonia solani AG-3 Rhs1AP]|uniref:Kinase domain protein n=1 Tax=Rhizoctonia solani AG-3 Rhs1AP TaxID=1086054 RepID=X8J9T6_9AGAM|nr:kinase domain protein [Rhizoctonia solani AG-3 Rhs1AP]
MADISYIKWFPYSVGVPLRRRGLSKYPHVLSTRVQSRGLVQNVQSALLTQACLAAHQMITRVQTIYERNMVYRDVKPESFLLELSATHTTDKICMIDLGSR